MRHHALYHLTGIAIVVLYFLFLLSGVLRTIVEDIFPWAISKEELAVTITDTQWGNNRTEWIPKIIHQVYLGWDNKEMPPKWKEAAQSCIDLNPDYEYKFWTNDSTRDLLTREYPWFLDTYDNYPYPIQRVDSIRYFLLAHYGGVYIDLDNGCKRNLDPLLSFPAWMPATRIHVGLTNHVMGTKRNHPYFELLINRLQAYDYNWVLPYLTTMNSAGPHFVSLVWEEYLRTSMWQDEVRIFMQEEYFGNEWSFFTKEEGGSWYHWDHEVFGWLGRHILFASLTVFLCICAATSCMWWVGYKLAGRARSKDVENFREPLVPLWQKAD